MKITTVVFLILCLFLSNSKATAQETAAEDEKITIKGTIVAFDGWLLTSNMTYAPQQQIFIVHIDHVLEGNEESNYIKVVYTYFRTDDKFLPDLLSDEKHIWEFLLSKAPSCNGTLKQLKYATIRSSEDGKVIGNQLKLKDLGGLDKISDDTELDCYELKTDGILGQRSRNARRNVTGTILGRMNYPGLSERPLHMEVLVNRRTFQLVRRSNMKSIGLIENVPDHAVREIQLTRRK